MVTTTSPRNEAIQRVVNQANIEFYHRQSGKTTRIALATLLGALVEHNRRCVVICGSYHSAQRLYIMLSDIINVLCIRDMVKVHNGEQLWWKLHNGSFITLAWDSSSKERATRGLEIHQEFNDD